MIPWEPEVLSRIRRLALVARCAVEGVLHGEHPSRALASSVTFADYKPYAPGDPVRDLDWRVWARTDRLVVRRTQAESDLPVLLVLDASGDMSTRPGGSAGDRPPIEGNKAGYALGLLATLAWYLYLRREPVGLAVLGGEDVPWRILSPRAGRHQLGSILGVLASVRPSGRADLGRGLQVVAAGLRRRSMLVLASDLMEEVESWAPALHALGRRRTDVRVLHLYDPRELDLQFPRPARFFSPEGGAPLALDPAGVREDFRAVVRAWTEEVRRAVTAWQGLYLPVPTDRPLADPLFRLLSGGSRRPKPACGRA
ncbi:MAG: DUF58 domain-containing protein [Deltaproteobacteria bacterium]|nr:DUF58 domain-containing protein [Deltaproteobacteria bacterium]